MDSTMDTITMTSGELADLIRRLSKREEGYYTVKEAAAYLRQRICTIRRFIREGQVRASMPTPGKIIVAKKDLDALVKRRRVDYDNPNACQVARMENGAKSAAKAAAARGGGAKAEPGMQPVTAPAEALETETVTEATEA